MSRSNDKTAIGKNYSINLFKCSIIAFILCLALSRIQAQTSFSNPTYYSSFSNEHSGTPGAFSADMDGDGDLDIVYGNRDINLITFATETFVHVRINDGLGDFSEDIKTVLSFTFSPEDFDVGDLNNDGLADIVAVGGSSGSPGFQIIMNTTTGGSMSFAAPVSYAPAENVGIEIVDINGDGNKDLIVNKANAPTAEISLFYGDGTGSNWSNNLDIDGNSGIRYSLIADFNGDNILDVMGIRTNSFSMYFFEGDSLPDGSPTGTFKSEVGFNIPSAPDLAIVTDINQDGLPDLVYTNSIDVYILINNNDGNGTSFTNSASWSTTSNRLGLAVADMGGDGHIDIIVSQKETNDNGRIRLYSGNGDGTFQTAVIHDYSDPETFGDVRATAADYNNDGLTDMAAIDAGLHVFLNSTKPDLKISQVGTDVNSGEMYDFGYIPIGSNSGVTTFTIDNDGESGALLNGTPKIQVTGPQASMFSVDESSTSATISPGTNTTFTITFTPVASDPGVNTAVVNIPSNDPFSPYIINLTGQTLLQPDNIDVSESPICVGESVTLTESNGLIGSGEQWVWYSGSCGGTQEGVGETIMISPSVTTDYFVRAETTGGTSLTGCTMGQVVTSGEVIALTTSSTVIKTINGEDQILTVTATGTSPSYQWLKDGVIVTDGGRISGSQTGTLTISTLEENDEATYTCEVTNFCSMESIGIALTILQLPPNSSCGTALDFDGSNDYVDLGQIFSPLNTITLEAWVNIDHAGNHPIISRDGTDFARASPYTLQVDPTTISFSINTGPLGKLIASMSLETNRWYHIACTYNGSRMRIYVDGELIGFKYHSGTLLNDNKLIIGAKAFFVGHTGGPRYSNAKIDEIRIWDISRNDTQILSTMTSALSGNEPNLIGYWDFDEGVGNSNIIDKTSNGNNGTLKNMNASTAWLTVDGIVDDDNSSISVSTCPDYLSPSGNFTWNTTGIYKDTLQTTMGCDSIVTVNLTIEPFDQIITFNSLSDATYGDSDITLSASSDLGLPVSFMSSDPMIATVSGSTQSIVGAGITTITASQVGGACSNPAPDVMQPLTVNKATLIATADDKISIYGEANPAFTFSYSGFVNGDDASVIDTPPTGATLADETTDTGNYPITGSGGLDNNYDFMFVDGTLSLLKRTLLGEIIDRTQAYGGTGTSEGYIYGLLGANFVNGDDESDLDNTLVQTSPVTANTPVGSYVISAIGNSNADNNYDVNVFNPGTYTVTAAPLTVAADHLAKVLNTANPALSISYSGFVNGEDESILSSLPTISTSANLSSPVGTYVINISGAAADNYAITQVDATLTVTNNTPLVITADSQTKIYNSSDPAFTYQLTSGTLMGGDVITGDLTRTPGEDAGNYTILPGTLTAGSNYSIVIISQGLTITPEALTITADNQINKAGSTNPVFTVSYDGFVNGEDESVLTALPIVSTTADINSPAGIYPITAMSATANNYSITYVDGLLDVFGFVPNTVCGNVLNFDGTDDYVEVGDVIEPTNITLEAWVNASNVSGRNGIVGKPFTSNSSPYYQYHLSVRDGGDVYFALSANGGLRTVRANSVVIANTWYHIAASYDGAVMKIYVDGVEVASSNATGDISNNSTSLTIGSSTGFEFNGQIDEVRIWDVGRTQTEIADNKDIKLQGNETNLVGYWDFDEGSGSDILIDKSTNGNDGTLTNMDPLIDWTQANGMAGGNSSSSIIVDQCGDYTSPSGNDIWTTTGIYQDIIPNQNGCDSLIIVDLTIQQMNQVIDFQPLANKIYGDADFILNATSGSGLPVTYSSSDPTIVTISGSMISIVGAGTTTITASQVGGSCFGPAIDVIQNLTIDPAAITITADLGQSKNYGGSDPVFSYLLTSGTLSAGDMITGNLTRVAGENVGMYAIEIGTLTAGSGYMITLVSNNLAITSKPITVTVDIGQAKFYGQTEPSLLYTITSGSLESGDLLSGNLDRTTGENVGLYAIQLGTLTAGSNYTIMYVDNNFVILTKSITITTGANQTKVYGDSDPVLSHSITAGSLESGDVLTGNLDRAIGENVANYAIGLGSLMAGSNYSITFIDADFGITAKPLTITADVGQTKVYSQTDPVFTYSTAAGALEVGDFFMGSLTRDIGESAGDYAITIGTLSAGGNYNVTLIPNDFGITAKPLSITVDANQSKVYGEADLTLTYAVTSGALETGDNFTGALDRVAGEEVGNYAIGQGNLTTGSNYSLTFNGTNFGITAKPLSITVDANQSKVYGGADLAFTYAQTGTLESGDLLTGVLARASGEDVGNYAINQGNLTAGSNYSITFNDSGFGITERSISITAVAATKQFGDADPALGYQITNGSLVSGDTFTGFLDRASGEDVGNYTINPGSLTAGTNYSIMFNDSDFGITSKPLTITVDANQNKVYGQADPVLTHAITSGSLESGDLLTGASARASGEDVGNYAINQGNLTAGGNYSISFNEADFGITAKPLIVAVDANQSKVYGQTDPVLTHAITSGSLETGDVFTGLLARTSGEVVGTYTINQGSLTAGSNYSIAFNEADFGITGMPLTITADTDQRKVYGDLDPALTYAVTSGALESGDALTGTLDRTSGENVGNYAIGQGSLSAGGNYTLSFVPNDFDITELSITITADAATKQFADPDPALSYQITSGSLVSGDLFTGSLTRVAGEVVGMYPIQPGTVDVGSNYAVTYIPDNLAITQADQTITFGSLADVKLSDAPFNLSATASSSLGVTYASSDQSVATVSGNMITMVGTGSTTITASQGGDASYNAAPNVVQSLTVNMGDQTITFSPLTDVTIGDPTFNLTGSASSGRSLSYVSSDPAVATVSGSTVTVVAIGTTTITASQAGDSDWNAAIDGTQSLTVNSKLSQTITFSALAAVTYGNADFTLIATGGASGNPVTFVSSNTAVATVSGSTVTIVSAGTTNITASQAGDASFNPAIWVVQGLTVDQRSISVVATSGQSKVYGVPEPLFAYSVSSGSLVSGDVFTGALDRAVGEDVGTYAIGQGNLTAGANYSIAFSGDNFGITAKALTVSADANQDKVYGQTDPTFTQSITSGSLETGDVLSGVLDRVAGENVGTYTINQGSLTAGGNYTITFNNVDFGITTKPLTITADANQSKVYGQVEPVFSYTQTGTLESGDALTGTLDRVSGEDVGNYAIGLGSLTAGSNYSLTFGDADFAISSSALMATADDQTRDYNVANPPLTITYAGFVNGENTSSIVEPTIATTATLSSNAGTYPITLSGGSALNYAITSNDGTLTIAPIAQTITFNALNDVSIGSADFNLSATATSGLTVNYTSDNLSVATVSGNTVTIVGMGAANIIASQSGDMNHNAAPDVSQSLTVNSKLSQTISFTSLADMTYGDVDFTLAATGGGSGNAIAYTSSDPTVATVSGSSVTILKVGTTMITASQAGDATHNPATDVTQSLTVDQRAITVTADVQSKTYGDVDITLTYSVTSGTLASGDAITGNLSREVGENVGVYEIQNSSLDAGSNYQLTYIAANLDITTRGLTLTADAQSKTYNDADPVLTYVLTSGALASGDALSGSLTRAVGEDAGAYAINQGTVSAGSNYAITFVSGDLTITGIALEITADAQSKTYGDADPTFTYTVTNGGIQNADLFTGSLTRVAGEDVGTYVVDIGTLSAGSNYEVTFVSGDLTITGRALEITADAQGKTYGDADPTFTYTVTNGSIQNGDLFIGTLSRSVGEDVGIYAINIGTVDIGSNYSLSFISVNLTIDKAVLTAIAVDQSRAYNQSNPTLTINYIGLMNGENQNVLDTDPIVSTSAIVTSVVGNYPITVSVGSDNNYDFNYVNGILTINKATQTIDFTTIGDRKLKDSPITLQASTTTGLAVNFTLLEGDGVISGNQLTINSIGSFKVAANQPGDDNYMAATVVEQAFEVTEDKADQTINFDVITDKFYGDVFNLTATASSTLAVNYIIMSGPATVVGSEVTITGVGQIQIKASQSGDVTFKPASDIVQNFNAMKVELTVSADNQSIEQGGDIPLLMFTYEGFVNGEDQGVIDTAPMISTQATTNSPKGDYEITLAGGIDDDYSFSFVNGTLTISQITALIDEILLEVKMYPVPFQDDFYIVLPEGALGEYNLIISDLYGKRIVTKKLYGSQLIHQVDDLHEMTGGIYMVQLSQGKIFKNYRIIKLR